MQKRTEATKGSASLFHKAIACILSVMLAMSYSSIAYAFDGEASDATVTTEDTSTSVAAADESAESVGATGAEEADGAASADAETSGADGFASLLSTSDRLAAISAGVEEAASASAQTNAIQTLSNTDGHFTVSGDTEGTDWTFDNNVIAINTAGTYTITGDDCDDHEGYQITVAGVSATITLKNVRISSSSGAAMNIDNTANVTLYLEGENSFDSSRYYAGIQFAGAGTGTSLEITSTTDGSLTAQGGYYAAGIGGGEYSSGNNITISGGTVTATGGERGAGIGGGFYGSASNIEISGGTVTATGGANGAGIGGGYRGSADTITITGGTVTAQGGYEAAGIGGGYQSSASNIEISGGTVTATSGIYAAGIGGGGTYASASNITISGGTVTATAGGYGGAGIGGGYRGSASNIKITGGTVTATADSNAQAIGSGYGGSATGITVNYTNGCYWRTSSSDSFTHSSNGSNVTTTGTYVELQDASTFAGGHFIVTGDDGWTYNNNSSTISITGNGAYTISKVCSCVIDTEHSGYQITIAGGITVALTLDNVKITSSGAPMSITNTANVTLYLVGDNSFISTATASGARGAGIHFEGSDSGSLTITTDEDPNGSLTAKGGSYGAGIGGALYGGAKNITIAGGTVTAIGGEQAAGIGGASGASANNIEITGGTVTATGGTNAAGIGGGNLGSASNIEITGGTVTATGNGGGAGIGGGSRRSGTDIVISNGSVKASSISVTPTDGDGNDVYLCEVPNMSGGNTVTVDDKEYTRSGDHPDDDGTFYLYLTGENHEITADGTDYRAVWDGDASSFTLKTYAAAPSATFTAADEDSGTLFGVDTTMQYSLDGGGIWYDIDDSTSIEITGVTAANDILVRYAETDTAVSYTQTIDVTQAAQPTAVSGTDCTTSEQNNGQITGVDSSMEYRLSTASEWTDITGDALTGLAPGTYYVRVKASETQLASTAATVTISAHTCSFTTYVYNDDATYFADGTETAICDAADCTQTDTRTAEGTKLIDSTAPYGEIKVEENSWKSFISTITFGIFCNDKYDVNITAGDDETGIAHIEYLLSETAISETDIADRSDWKTYENSFSLEDEGQYIIYAKITDNAGNVTYLSSDGLVLDKTAPVIGGLEDGKTYCSEVTFTVDDEYIDSVTVNGEPVTEYVLNANGTTYTVKAYDKAGNESLSYTVTVNGGHTFTSYVSDNNATCTEDGTETAPCDHCDVTDTQTEADSALGHDWDEPVWSWESGYSSATATFTCTNDDSHTQALTAEITEVRTEPTETDEGSVVYTATVELGGSTYTETETVVIPATGTATDPDPSDPGDGDESASDTTKSGWTRLAGSGRYETMVEVVKEAFADGSSSYVVIASGQNFADSLTASSLAGVLDAPIILVGDSLTEEAIAQITRLGATRAYIVGGTASVSESVATQVANIAGIASVERVSGDDRYATAVAVAEKTVSLLAEEDKTLDTVILASGAVYADALSISPYAYTKAAPIILVGSDGLLDDDSAAWIASSGATSLIVVGGTASVADGAITQTGISNANSERLDGDDRYETSVKIAEWAIENEYLSANGAVVASGETFPDALASSALCGQLGSVLVLVSNSLSTELENFLTTQASSLTYGYIVGGTSTISATVAEAIEAASGLTAN